MAKGEAVQLEAGGPAAKPSFNVMGRLYKKIAKLSIVSRYLTYIIPVSIVLAIPLLFLALLDKLDAPLGKSAATGKDTEILLPGPPFWILFAWLELTWLSLWVSKGLSCLFSPTLVFLVGGVRPMASRYASMIESITTPLSLFLWLLASCLLFKGLVGGAFDTVEWVAVLKTTLGALFVSSAVLLGEKTMVRLLSVTYHERSLAHRIAKNNDDIAQLGKFYDLYREDGVDPLRQNLSAKKTVREKLELAIGKLDDSCEDLQTIISTALKGKDTRDSLVGDIWNAFQLQPGESLTIKPDGRGAWLQTVDADGDGCITQSELRRSAHQIAEERRIIKSTWNDISQAIHALDEILLCIVFLLAIFIFLIFFRSSFIATLATAGTALVSLSFVFAVTTQELLGSCIFLFVKHPYDVGDRVVIAGVRDQTLVVHKISLLYTVFTEIQTMQTVQVPNIVLNNLWIENNTRSNTLKEKVELGVSFDTDCRQIEALRMGLEKTFTGAPNHRHFKPDVVVYVVGVGNLDRLALHIEMEHMPNWQDDVVRARRRSKLVCEIARLLKTLLIRGPGADDSAPLNKPT